MGSQPVDRVDKTERITDLVALLLHTPRPLAFHEIVHQVTGYPEGETALRAAFERDKRLLREEGIPLTVQEGEVPTYRIRPEDYYLPDLGLSEDETLALNLAATAVRLEGASAEGALWKLGGVAAAAEPLVDLPSLPELPLLHQAVRQRALVHFRYSGRARELEPLGLLTRAGFWYVQARERGDDKVKNFRVDRIEGPVGVGEPGSFVPPEGFRPQRALPEEPWQLGGEDPIEADVLVDRVHADRVAAEVGDPSVVERRQDGSVVVRLVVTNRTALRSWLLGMLGHARVLAPADLVTDVVAWLESIAGARPSSPEARRR